MSPRTRLTAFLAACTVCPALGVWLAHRQATAPIATHPASTGEAKAAVEGPMTWDSVKGDRALMVTRLVAKMDTTSMWTWLLEPESKDAEFRRAMLAELADRLGWKAWDEVLAIPGDMGLPREELCDEMLSELSHRDIWRAWDEFIRHRGEFTHPRWGRGVVGDAMIASTAVSADRLLEVFDSAQGQEIEEMVNTTFAPNFDFARVMDWMAQSGSRPVLAPGNLLSTWAARAPAAAASWLAAHPEQLNGNIAEVFAGTAFGGLVTASGPDRPQILASLASLPQETLDRWWDNQASSGGGKIDAANLEAATLMQNRDRWLAESLVKAKSGETLDSSWQLVPEGERASILEQADRLWAGRASSELASLARQRWKRMVASEWDLPGE